MLVAMDEVKYVAARSERATPRVGEVFLKVDADRARIDISKSRRWFSHRCRPRKSCGAQAAGARARPRSRV